MRACYEQEQDESTRQRGTHWKMELNAPALEEGSHLNLVGNEVFAQAEPKWKQSHAARENEQQSKIGGGMKILTEKNLGLDKELTGRKSLCSH
jgi:hypothetical protein